MNKRIKAKWIKALRSGEYKQAKGQLREGDAFCCLGVLCNLHAQEHPRVAAKQDSTSLYLGADRVLPSKVRDWAGLEDTIGRYSGLAHALSIDNDAGKSFEEIAEIIKENF